jgi:hypothetical protein
MRTLTDVLTPHGIDVADTALADIDVPVLAGPQRQGDVLILPCKPIKDIGQPVPAAGVAVVRGEATGNTHMLSGWGGPVFWKPSTERAGSLILGHLTVPEGSVADLVHTDEHGANCIAPGTYRLSGKREQADEIRRVAD